MVIEYVVCPLCRISRVLNSQKRVEKGKPATYRFSVDQPVSDLVIIQLREGGGKQPGKSGKKGRGRAPGAGFTVVDGLTLRDMVESGRYSDVLEDLKRQLMNVQTGFKEL